MKVTTDKTKSHDINREEVKAIVQKMCLMDDDFMTMVLNDKKCVELVLKIILDKDDLEVIDCKTQYTVSSLQNRSIRLDVFARDSTGKLYDIEIQNVVNEKEETRRIRLYSALIDSNYLNKSEKAIDLPETYIIFIMGSDMYEKGLPLYNVERKVKETQALFDDGLHIILVNSQYRDDSALGKLMHDFHCTEPEKMNFEVLSEKAHFYKTGEGETKMCQLVEDFVNRKVNEEIQHNKTETAKFLLLNTALTYKQIAQASKLTVEQVKEIKKSMK